MTPRESDRQPDTPHRKRVFQNLARGFIRWLASYLLLVFITVCAYNAGELIMRGRLAPIRDLMDLGAGIIITAFWATSNLYGRFVTPFTFAPRARTPKQTGADVEGSA